MPGVTEGEDGNGADGESAFAGGALGLPVKAVLLCLLFLWPALPARAVLVASRNLRVGSLTFEGNEEAQHKGKGYGEGRILEHAVRHSRCIERAGTFYKVTGRLYGENIAEIIDAHAAFPNVFNRGDTRFFKSSVAFFRKHLESRYHEVDDAHWMSIEALFIRALEGCMPTEVCQFLVHPVVVGQSATDMCIYDKWYSAEVQSRIVELRAMIAR